MRVERRALDLPAGHRHAWREWIARLWESFLQQMDVACLHPSVTAGMSAEELEAYVRMWI